MVRVLWKTSSLNNNIASIRYRCLIPNKYLNAQGILSDLYWKKKAVQWSDYTSLIFVKTFTDHDIQLAKEAKASGLKVGFDLCDNIYYDYPETHDGLTRNKASQKQRAAFESILTYCDFIVVPTEPLKQEISQRTKLPIFVVPDAIETEDDSRDFDQLAPQQTLKSLKAGLQNAWTLFKLRTRQKFQNKKFVLWFGNSGFPQVFGITDLLMLKDILNEILHEKNAELLVCSDNFDFFKTWAQPQIPQSVFIAWNSRIVTSLLKISHLVILPNPSNVFTKGKSNNRALLALYNQTPVVASQTSSTLLLKNFARIEDWNHNISELLEHKTELASECPQTLLQTYGGAAIASLWKSVLESNETKIDTQKVNADGN